MGCHFLLQGIFPIQGLNPGLPHCGQTLYCLSHQARPECSKQPETCSENMLYMAFILFLIFSIFILSSGEGNGNPLQYSCLENPVDRGAWWAAVHRVTQSRTRLKRLSMHACIGEGNNSPLQCSCLENPRDRGAWWAVVYGVTQSWTRLKRLSSSSIPSRVLHK